MLSFSKSLTVILLNVIANGLSSPPLSGNLETTLMIRDVLCDTHVNPSPFLELL